MVASVLREPSSSDELFCLQMEEQRQPAIQLKTLIDGVQVVFDCAFRYSEPLGQFFIAEPTDRRAGDLILSPGETVQCLHQRRLLRGGAGQGGFDPAFPGVDLTDAANEYPRIHLLVEKALDSQVDSIMDMRVARG